MIIGIDGNEANSIRPDINARVGVNQYAFGLLCALYKTDEENIYHIYLSLPPKDDLPNERDNWKYKVIGPAKFWTQWRLPLELFLKKPRPDVFFSPSHYAPRFSPVPIVISVMDLGFYRFPEQFRKKDLWQLKSWTEYSAKKAAHILTISESTKKDIIARYGVRPEKITVTYPGYDKEKFKYQIPNIKIKEIKKRYKIKGEYLLFLGVLKPNKNVESLLEAFKTLTSHESRVTSHQLVIAGKKGWLYESIFQKIKELGLEDKVIFTDFIPDEDIPALMAGAKVFVLPSFWEGFGIPVVEAMAVGTPVVVSDAGSLPEIVGDVGVIVNPYDPNSIAEGLQKVISLPENQYNRLKTRVARQAARFDWADTARRTLEVLKEGK